MFRIPMKAKKNERVCGKEGENMSKINETTSKGVQSRMRTAVVSLKAKLLPTVHSLEGIVVNYINGPRFKGNMRQENAKRSRASQSILEILNLMQNDHRFLGGRTNICALKNIHRHAAFEFSGRAVDHQIGAIR